MLIALCMIHAKGPWMPEMQNTTSARLLSPSVDLVYFPERVSSAERGAFVVSDEGRSTNSLR